eukprot:TRINITY_DN11554_c0_g1_i1.p1 TRINITY_DN11554_c0_g1~~TRINITY_DN11554_c0_g1_i1.p1  ORF type:complete len:558 (-),score=122.42 TRINITY_DN11554_c0_g1_i1:101-1774(-)
MEAAAPALQSRTSLGELPDTPAGVSFPRVAQIVRSEKFEAAVGLAILLNCGTIGLQVNAMVEDVPSWQLTLASASEHFFTAFFLLEFCLRVAFFGYQNYTPCWPGPTPRIDVLWNLSDACLVWITGVGTVWVAPVVGVDVGRVRIMTMLRAIRLMRLVKAVRKMPQFAEVYLLVRGLSDSMRTLFWTVIVIFFITYIFATFGVVLLSVPLKDIYQDAEAAGGGAAVDLATLKMLYESSNSLMAWIYTLIQVLTTDSWTGISRPMEEVLPGAWVFFVSYIALAAVVFLNLVTAVIVENALEHSKNDEETQLMHKEEALRKAFQNFKHLFYLMDEDGDQVLSKEEFTSAFQHEEIARKLKLLDFKEEECKEIFDLLDEGDETLTLDEFFYGLQQMKGDASAKEVYILGKFVDRVWDFILQFSLEADEDVEQLFRHLGLGSLRGHRNGPILARASKAAKYFQKDSPANKSLASNEAKPGEEDSMTELAHQVQGIISQVDGLSKSLSMQVQTLSDRLTSVEESSLVAERSVQQLMQAPMLEPKLKVKQGMSLGRGCCSSTA